MSFIPIFGKGQTETSQRRKKVGYVLAAIALGMFFLSLSVGGNPLNEWHGILLWGGLIFLCFQEMSAKKFWSWVVGLIVIFVLLSAMRSVGADGISNRTYEDALNDPPPSGGQYLNAQEFGIKIGQYLPLTSDLSPAKKLELCLDVAEEHFFEVTTPQQRKQGCSYYAAATKTDYQEGMKAVLEHLDKLTPDERIEFCRSRGPELFGRNVTKEEADDACVWVANNWAEARKMIEESIPQ